MLKGQELDQFLDEFLDAGSAPVVREEKDGHDLEEYTLPSDGLIIRQMKKDGTGIAVYICQNLSWKKIPSVQPDSCSCRNVAVFYDV